MLLCGKVNSYLVDICQWFFILHQHLGKLSSLLWVDSHHITQKENVVWGVVDLLGVENYLLELTSLRKTLDHLWWIIKLNEFILFLRKNDEHLMIELHITTK